ncbi:MAG: DUF433 domain-containing protein [Desulfurococcales archaeon]|nr:DUF433 domain-containing protein [Desulfurococcales archaeon]
MNLKVISGRPVIRGTRITDGLILGLLASGMVLEGIAEDFRISIEDVRTAQLYVAKILGREELVVVEAEA